MSKGLDVVSLNKRAWERVAEKYYKAHYGKVSEVFNFFVKSFLRGVVYWMSAVARDCLLQNCLWRETLTS